MPDPTSSPSIYRPRSPRASPLWQIVHHSWNDFLADYESKYRKIHGPLRPFSIDAVNDFYKCGDLSAGFTRLQCPNPDCGHERLLAFTCKSRHICPACHQRRVLATADWIAETLCKPVPHRQFVFTMPRMLRGIFRKRRHLLDHLFKTATESLRDWMRLQLDLPDGKLAAIAGVQTFGDYLVFHPHLHILSASGLFDQTGTFHLLPAASTKSLDALTELFRHRFILTLVDHKLLTEKKARDLLNWKHSGFNLDAGEKPVAADDIDGRRQNSGWRQEAADGRKEHEATMLKA